MPDGNRAAASVAPPDPGNAAVCPQSFGHAGVAFHCRPDGPPAWLWLCRWHEASAVLQQVMRHPELSESGTKPWRNGASRARARMQARIRGPSVRSLLVAGLVLVWITPYSRSAATPKVAATSRQSNATRVKVKAVDAGEDCGKKGPAAERTRKRAQG